MSAETSLKSSQRPAVFLIILVCFQKHEVIFVLLNREQKSFPQLLFWNDNFLRCKRKFECEIPAFKTLVWPELRYISVFVWLLLCSLQTASLGSALFQTEPQRRRPVWPKPAPERTDVRISAKKLHLWLKKVQSNNCLLLHNNVVFLLRREKIQNKRYGHFLLDQKPLKSCLFSG